MHDSEACEREQVRHDMARSVFGVFGVWCLRCLICFFLQLFALPLVAISRSLFIFFMVEKQCLCYEKFEIIIRACTGAAFQNSSLWHSTAPSWFFAYSRCTVQRIFATESLWAPARSGFGSYEWKNMLGMVKRLPEAFQNK